MAAVCDIRCQTRDDFPDWHFNFPSWRDLLDMIQLKQRQRMGRWFVKYGTADAGTPDASTSGRQEAASGWQDSGSAHGRSGPALPSVKASLTRSAVGDGSGSDDSDDDDGDGNHHNLGKGQAGGVVQAKMLLACPFYKRRPNACKPTGFRDLAQVK